MILLLLFINYYYYYYLFFFIIYLFFIFFYFFSIFCLKTAILLFFFFIFVFYCIGYLNRDIGILKRYFVLFSKGIFYCLMKVFLIVSVFLYLIEMWMVENLS